MAVALLILSRGRGVDVGIGASVLWVVAILPFLALPYLTTNVVLALMQGVIVLRRYETAIWESVRNVYRSADSAQPSH